MGKLSDLLRVGIWAVAVLLLPLVAVADNKPPAGDNAAQGHALYLRYCSACHGPAGKGDGIVSGMMRPRPADLTHLAKRAGGTFNAAAVAATIDGRQTMRAHGDPDMPVWGEILTTEQAPALDKETVARTKVLLITDYLASIQAK
ncbi:MAG: c-type cytochrome [Deltaproteobacteria bacterium]|nr:c-type cytochrome [Deltaproteobacteria bacterium]